MKILLGIFLIISSQALIVACAEHYDCEKYSNCAKYLDMSRTELIHMYCSANFVDNNPEAAKKRMKDKLDKLEADGRKNTLVWNETSDKLDKLYQEAAKFHRRRGDISAALKDKYDMTDSEINKECPIGLIY